ncbi:MAG: TatD family hydrolase [Bacteroidota bacterium]
MILIDTHSHIYLDDFNNDRDAVVKAALANDIRYILLPNIDSETTESLLQLASAYPDVCLPMMGLHPTSVKENYKEELFFMEENLKKYKFYAIGETGIDLYWDTSFIHQQEEAFRRQLDLSLEYDLPIVIHCRKSFDEIIHVLHDYKNNMPHGVFHCFPGDIHQAEIVIEMGFFLGIGGVVSYKNSSMQKLMYDVGLEHIILETDAPFLTPVPHRGKRNESAYILHIAQAIEQLKGVSIEEVAAQTSDNAVKLFNIQAHAQ